MATTLRLPIPLQARVDAYAKSIGVSVSALVAIALVEYLDVRVPPVVEAPPVDPEASKAVRQQFEAFAALSAAERVQERKRLERLTRKAGK